MLLNSKFEPFMKFCLMLTVIITMFSAFSVPATAAAQSGNSTVIQNILCNVSKQISGPIGKTIAILVVISVAVGLFLGKITWGVAIAVAVGMGVLFGAEGIVKLISGDTSTAICV